MTDEHEQVEESDPGFLGGGGPAQEIEPDDPASEDAFLADTDHDER